MNTIEQCDNELIYMIRCGNKEAFELLSSKYEKVIKKYIIENYNDAYIYGWEVDDLIEECMITFYEALSCFIEDKGTFYSYVIKSVKFRVYDLIKIALSNKNVGFNYLTTELSFLSNNEKNKDIDGFYFDSEETNPINHFQLNETTNIIFGEDSNLTKIERQVISLKVMGYQIDEISEKLDINKKRIEYIIKRAKFKIKELIK